MARRKLIKKGISKEKTFISLVFRCENGIDTYSERYYIDQFLFTGYGCCEKKPDFTIEIFGVKYECFYGGKTIGYENKCRIAK